VQVFSAEAAMPKLLVESGPQAKMPKPLSETSFNNAKIDASVILKKTAKALPATDNPSEAVAKNPPRSTEAFAATYNQHGLTTVVREAGMKLNLKT